MKTDKLKDKWRLPEPELDSKTGSRMRIDHYWKHFLDYKNSDGELKYPNVSAVVKACQCWYHGNSDVKRGISMLGCVLTDDNAAMSLRMLNARLTVLDGMRDYDCKPHLVPVTRKLGHQLHASYSA